MVYDVPFNTSIIMFSNHGKFFLKQRDLKEPCPEDEHKGCLLVSSKPHIPLEKHIHRNNFALNTKTFECKHLDIYL